MSEKKENSSTDKYINIVKKNKINIILLLLFILTFISPVEKLIQDYFTGPIYKDNIEYLNQSADKAFKTFAVLSLIKGTLHVVEGSDIRISPFGMGISIQVGDMVQSLVDIVDMAWQITLISTITLESTKYMLMIAHLFEIKLVSFLILFTLFLRFFATRENIWLFKVSRFLTSFTLVLTLLALIFIPLTVTGSQWLSEKTTAKLKASASKEITLLQNELNQFNFRETIEQKQVVVEKKKKGFFEKLNPGKLYDKMDIKYGNLKDKITGFFKWLKLKTVVLKNRLKEIIVTFILDTIVFPLLLLVIFIFAGKFLVRELFTQDDLRDFKLKKANNIVEKSESLKEN